jgi:hypothetical protein
MTAPASVPVAITVKPSIEADRVIYQFGDQIYALPVADAAILVSHTLASIEILRPHGATGTVQ